MKYPLIILIVLLIKGNSAFAVVGDVYYCQTSKVVKIYEENVEEFQEERFTFKRSKDKLFFGKGFFKESIYPLKDSLDDEELFIGSDELNTFSIHYQDGEFHFSKFKFGDSIIVVMANCENF